MPRTVVSITLITDKKKLGLKDFYQSSDTLKYPNKMPIWVEL